MSRCPMVACGGLRCRMWSIFKQLPDRVNLSRDLLELGLAEELISTQYDNTIKVEQETYCWLNESLRARLGRTRGRVV